MRAAPQRPAVQPGAPGRSTARSAASPHCSGTSATPCATSKTPSGSTTRSAASSGASMPNDTWHESCAGARPSTDRGAREGAAQLSGAPGGLSVRHIPPSRDVIGADPPTADLAGNPAQLPSPSTWSTDDDDRRYPDL